MAEPKAKVIQIAMGSEGLVALMDDGTIWNRYFVQDTGKWKWAEVYLADWMVNPHKRLEKKSTSTELEF